MARPANADAAATRGRILSEAGRLFSAHGPSAVSIRDIAREAKVSLAMVHHYFGSKEELYAASVEAMYAELAGVSAELTGVLAESRDLVGTLEAAAVRGFRFARAHEEAMRTVMRVVVETGALPAGRAEATLVPFLDAVEQLVGPLAPHLPAAELRLRAQTVCFVVARYALATIGELALMVGAKNLGDEVGPALTPAAREARVLALVESHLSALAVSLIAPPASPASTH